MATARGLGKGLDTLIPTGKVEVKSKKSTEKSNEVKEPTTTVKITMVEPNREQPRKNFDQDALEELADSIKQYGLIQPIVVQDRKTYYEIIAGERRWRAAKIAGLKEVPVIIKNYTEQEIVEISLIENIQRENLNPIEEAMAYKRLLNEFNLKQDEVAERVSKSRTAVTNSMRLLKLCDEVQQMIIDEMITTGHARALISVEDPEQQYILAQKIFDEKLSVRDVEKLVKDLGKTKKEKKAKEKKLIAQQKKQQKTADELNRKIQALIDAEVKKESKKGSSKQNKITLTKEESLIAGNFEKNKGRLPWPVEKGFVSGKFGIQKHPVLEHVTTNNKGIYIQTNMGADARAVFEGVVTQCFSIPGSNNAVIIKHGNYRTVYTNLTTIYVKEGDKVTAKQKIGRIFVDEENDNKTEMLLMLYLNTTLLNPEPWLAK